MAGTFICLTSIVAKSLFDGASLCSSCGRVVRDFESEAKLGVTFNFDKFGWQTKAKMRRYPGKPEAVIFFAFFASNHWHLCARKNVYRRTKWKKTLKSS